MSYIKLIVLSFVCFSCQILADLSLLSCMHVKLLGSVVTGTRFFKKGLQEYQEKDGFSPEWWVEIVKTEYE